jgi:nucleotidyltransferase substrate binding protein (TIGR01987 family)
MEPRHDIRWKQRFQNFDRAFVLLRDAMALGATDLNQLESEGVILRFEYCFQLAWKTAKNYLEQGGFVFAFVSPRQVLKDAFASKLVTDGQVWIDMLDHRNLLSHSYSVQSFENAVQAIRERYLHAFAALHERLHAEAMA